MDTARCRAFAAAVKTGSFTKAAEELNYTTSGVSQLVSALEQDLGLTLLNRSRKGITLTSDGEAMYPVITRFLENEDEVYQTASNIKGLLIGTIRIAAYSSVASAWLPRLISRFNEMHPAVKITVNDGNRLHVAEALTNNQADIAFLTNLGDFTAQWIPLQVNPLVAMVSVNSPYAAYDSFPLKACETEPLILSSLGHDDDIYDMFERNNIHPNIVYATFNSSASAAMAEQNMGIVLVNELSTHMWHYNLKQLPFDPPQSEILGMAIPQPTASSPAVKAFTAFVQDHFQYPYETKF